MAGTDKDFLSRWSRRKRAARSGVPAEDATPPATAAVAAPAAPASEAQATASPQSLTPVDELTHESDFTPFMDRKVDPGLRRQALRKLFTDPQFNVMDGLDVYIDDYSIPDPIPPEWLGQLAQMAGLGDVPGRERAEREARELAERGAREVSEQGPADPGNAPAGQVPEAPDDLAAAEGGHEVANEVPAVAGPGEIREGSGKPSGPIDRGAAPIPSRNGRD